MSVIVKASILLLSLSGLTATAGPISYEGGWMFSTENQPDFVNWQVSYSLKPWLSIGVDYAYDRMANTEATYLLPRLNYLVKRWNETDSQGNIYIFGSLGGVRAETISSLAWQYGIEADWETRKFYTSTKIQVMDSKDLKNQSLYQARVGLAPYLTAFENLHSWVILEVQYWPKAIVEKIKVTPMMRFYIDNVLWEMGVSAQGTWMFNTMIHF